MSRSSEKVDKQEVIARILKQDVYLPASGMIRQLTKSLSRLSPSDLENLELIFALKCDWTLAMKVKNELATDSRPFRIKPKTEGR